MVPESTTQSVENLTLGQERWVHKETGFSVRKLRAGVFYATSPEGQTRQRSSSCILLSDPWSRAAAAFMEEHGIGADGLDESDRDERARVLQILREHVLSAGFCACDLTLGSEDSHRIHLANLIAGGDG